MAPHDERYAMADEYMSLAYQLWEESWDDGAAVRNRASMTFSDPQHIRAISHEGKYLNCHAVHLSEPSPQRTPVIFSAGASATETDFVGKRAECAFTAYGSRGFARRQVGAIRENCLANGRSHDDVRVFVPATVIVAATDAEARDIQREYEACTDGAGNLATRSQLIGIDLSKYSPDDPVPGQKTNASQSAGAALTSGAARPLRIRDLMDSARAATCSLSARPPPSPTSSSSGRSTRTWTASI